MNTKIFPWLRQQSERKSVIEAILWHFLNELILLTISESKSNGIFSPTDNIYYSTNENLVYCLNVIPTTTEKGVTSIVYDKQPTRQTSENGKWLRKEIFLINFQIDEFENDLIFYREVLLRIRSWNACWVNKWNCATWYILQKIL